MFVAIWLVLACFPEIREGEERRFVDNPSVDNDGDNFTEEDGDCNDRDDEIHPSAIEICDGIDNDCNGFIDDNPVDIGTWYLDSDGDGFGDESTELIACVNDKPDDYIESLGTFDCDDNDADLNPSDSDEDGVSTCDGDCDDFNQLIITKVVYYEDADGDGFGIENNSELVCPADKSDGYVEEKVRNERVVFDCDDTRSDVHPDMTEQCDDVDNDCNELIDDYAGLGADIFYLDADRDGYGDISSAMYACSGYEPDGYILQVGDCDDVSPNNHPDAEEFCDGEDNNCNGIVDEPTASDATIWYEDADGDGYGSMIVSVPDCEQPPGYVDDNTDCNDTEATAYVGAIEYCNGYDDNCDGTVDENTAIDAALYYPDSDGDQYGAIVNGTPFCYAQSGYVTNSTDCNDTLSTINPAADEVCNNLDDDCDGGIDDADPDNMPLQQQVYYVDADGDQYGDSSQVVQSCPDYINGVAEIPIGLTDNGLDCDDTSDDLDGDGVLDGFIINPSADELCTEFIDENCDGLPMVGAIDTPTYYADFDFDGYGNASHPVQVCQQPYGYVLYETGDKFDCDDTDPDTRPTALDSSSSTYAEDLLAEESCNGKLDRCENDPSGGLNLLSDEIDDDGDGFVDCVLDVDPSQWADVSVTVPIVGGEDCDDNNVLFYPEKSWYYDNDGDGWGNINIVEMTCQQPSGYVDQTEDCNDSSAFTFPGAAPLTDPVACLTDIDGDGESDRLWDLCDQYQDTDSARLEISVSNDAENVVKAGDVDGDGIDDVLMVANSTSYSNSGKVYLFLGATLQSGSISYDYRFTHNVNGILDLGVTMSTAGDVDGDGLDDLLIGSIATQNYPSMAPSAFLILGSQLDPNIQSLSMTSSSVYAFIGEFAYDNMSMRVGYAGDVDGDGRGDFLVGSPASNRVYLFFGSSLDLTQQQIQLADADYIFVGNSGDRAGSHVSGLGDVDGDGLDDIGIGAADNDDGATDGGKIYVVLANSLDPTAPIFDLNNADYQLIGSSRNHHVSNIRGGNIDGDGLSDIVISTPMEDSLYQANSFKGYVVLGSTLNTSSSTISLSGADYVFSDPVDYIDHGIQDFDIGDVDGDGLQDIVFGVSMHDLYGEQYVGRANLFLGSSLPSLGASVSINDADYIFTGVPGDGGTQFYHGLHWGHSVALSDFDGDGQADVFMGGKWSHKYMVFSPCEN